MSSEVKRRIAVPRLIAHALAVVFLTSLLAVGGRTAVVELRDSIAFYQSHRRPIPIGIERAAAYVHSQVPADAPVLLLVSTPDAWDDGLWQRALYPNPIFLLYKNDLGTREDHQLRARYLVRFAVSIGAPPLDPAFRWRRPVPGWTGPGQVAFGEVDE